MFALEAVAAKFGDSLLLHFGTTANPKLAVIDGGPPGVFGPSLRPRLEEIRQDRGLADDQPLPIELMMVSHLDADHIAGIIELMQELKDLRDAHEPQPWKISRFWHNAFDDVIGNKDPAMPASASSMTASLGGLDLGPVTDDATAILATVPQGRTLRDLIRAMLLNGNKPFDSLVMFGHAKNPVKIDGLELTVVGPDKERLQKLQDDWDVKIKPLLKKKDKAAKAEVAAYVDGSVYNLSSIVVLAKFDGHSMLLTGDARGDYTIKALEKANLLDNGKLHVDILKLPHHGSNRNVALQYFQTITADHYVVSADGTYDNPDADTLGWISASRADDDFTIYLTNPLDEFAKDAPAKAIRDFRKKEKAKARKYGWVERKKSEKSIRIDL
jgi:hypothetical protein